MRVISFNSIKVLSSAWSLLFVSVLLANTWIWRLSVEELLSLGALLLALGGSGLMVHWFPGKRHSPHRHLFIYPTQLLFILLWSYLCWFIISLEDNHFWARWILLGIVVINFMFLARKGLVNFNSQNFLQMHGWAQLRFVGILIIFLSMNSFGMGESGGEKGFDWMLFHYFTRLESPALLTHPFYLGEQLHYYYWGYLLWAKFFAIFAIAPQWGYYLALSMVETFAVLIAWQTFSFLLQKKYGSVGWTLVMFAGGTLGVLWQTAFWSGPWDITLFWKSSRVFSNSYFAEFPLWTILWSDLHPHLLSMPILLLVILLCCYLGKYGFSGMAFAFLAMSWGFLWVTNVWDFIFLLPICLYQSIFYRRWWLLVSPLGGVLFLWPVIIQILGKRPLPLQLVFNDWQGWWPFFSLQGHFWILTAGLAFTALATCHRSRWKIGLLLLLGLCYYLALNTVLIMDRLNTVFKAVTFGNLIFWVLLAQAGACYWRCSKYLRWMSTSVMVVLLLASIPLWFSITRHYPPGMGKKEFISPALNSEQQELIRYVRQNISGTPGIIEPQSPSYQFGASLINLNTGLPSYLSWDQHVWVQGHPYHQVMERKELLPKLLANFSQPEMLAILKQANICYLLVSPNVVWDRQLPFSVVYASSNYLLLAFCQKK